MLRVVFNKTVGKYRIIGTSFYCTAHVAKEKEECRYHHHHHVGRR